MLNLSTQSGNYDSWIKWNSKAGRFYVKGENGEVEVMPTSFIADLENIKTGWLHFQAGQAPSRMWDENLTTPLPQPTPNHKRGFSLRLFSNQTFGGIVELSSSSMHLCASISDLYTAFNNDKGNHAGQVPVVKFTGSTTMKDAKGMNYKPNFIIEKWVARPKELETTYEQSVTTSAPVQQQAPAAPVSTGVSEF